MPVPEAAVDKQCDASTREDDVGSTRQIRAMEAEPQPQSMGEPPNSQLGRGVLLTHAGHALAALRRRKSVHGPMLAHPSPRWQGSKPRHKPTPSSSPPDAAGYKVELRLPLGL